MEQHTTGISRLVYIMTNKDTGVSIRTTRKYLNEWLARGFKVSRIEYR